MDIVPYRDLKIKEDVFILWLKSFGWPGSAGWLANFKKYETRIGNGPIGICGLIDGKLVGFVGIMIIPTRTRHGEIENVGGIYAVAVRPSYMRQGIGRKLLDASENYMRQQGMKLSFLTTSRSIVAFQWYCDIGYEVVETVDNYPYMYKTFNPPRSVNRKSRADKKNKLNIREVQKLFDWYSDKHCGFVIRNLRELKSREMADVFSKKLSIMVDGGYALLKSSCDAVQYKEILARNQKTYRELIKLAEAKAKYGAVAICPFDSKAQKALRKAHYLADFGSYAVLMCKPLAGTTFTDLYDDGFMFSDLDSF